MTQLAEHLATLSPEKRRLLELRLRKQGVDVLQLPIVPQKRDIRAFPLSFAQQRLWFLDQWAPGNPFYNIPNALRVTGKLHTAALEQSLNHIVRRHEALRITYTAADGQPFQVISPTLAVPLAIADLRELSETARDAEGLRLTAEEAQRAFDLTRGPLLRITLLRLDEHEHVLLLTMHHIIADGWSMGILVWEVMALYEAFSTGTPPSLPELPIQYIDFAAWQRQWFQESRLEARLTYWKQQLGGSPPVLALPTDRPRPAVNAFRGACQTFAFPPALTAGLKALSEQVGVTLFMGLRG